MWQHLASPLSALLRADYKIILDCTQSWFEERSAVVNDHQLEPKPRYLREQNTIISI
jgi:hypothetical protein